MVKIFQNCDFGQNLRKSLILVKFSKIFRFWSNFRKNSEFLEISKNFNLVK